LKPGEGMPVPSNLRASGRCLAAGALAVLLSSCSGDGRPRAYPCKGTVLVNGQPAKGVEVSLRTDMGNPVAGGICGEGGVFELTTYVQHDGAPAGDYEVAIFWPAWHRGKNVGPDRLQGQFEDPKKTGLRAHVEAPETTLPPFQITAQVLPESAIQMPGK